MDHSVLAITQLYSRAKFYQKLVFVFTLTFLTFSGSLYAQKKSEKEIIISPEKQEELNNYFFDGIRQKNIDNYDASVRSFLKVLEINPSHAAASYELGLIYTKQKKYSQAMSSLAIASELDPNNEWYLKAYAESAENTGNYKLAQEVFEKLIQKFPDRVENYFDLASVKIYQNDFKGAIKVYDEIQKRIGINEDVTIQKQKIWLKLGKVDKAAEEAKALIKFQPTEMRYRMNLAEIYLANNKLDEAIVVLNEILSIEPNNSFVQLALADYYREKKDDKKSYQYLKLAFANPDLNIDQKVRILSPYFSGLNNVDVKQQAFELSKLLTEAHPNEAKAFAIYGDFLYQDKQNEAAMAAYKKTIALDKKVFAVWQNLMFIEVDMNDYKSLLQTSNEALDLFPSQQLVHYLNAIAKSQLKDFEGAIISYKNALDLGVGNTETEAQLLAGMGDAYHSLNKHEESDNAYDKALKLKPDEPYVLNNYAYYLSLRNEKLEKALEMSARSNQLLKDNSSFLDTYAWILFRLARYTEALEWINKAVAAGGSKSATIIEHKGDIFFKLGKVQEAVIEWKNAAAISEPSDLLKKKINEQTFYE